MIDLLPKEIVENILNQFNYDNDPFKYYDLRYVNSLFNQIVMSKTRMYPHLPFKYDKRTNISQRINNLCCKKTSVETFEWIMKNGISFHLHHIRNLIMKNRLDVLKVGARYLDFLDVLFNRFYLNDFSDLFTFSDSTSPLIIAGTYNKVEIVKFLVESSNYGNPYLSGIGALFELSIKHTHRNLLSYLINKHYEKIKDKLDIKIYQIIQRFNNIEDILFFLVLTKRIDINQRFLAVLIVKKKYNDLFIFCFLKIFKSKKFLDTENLLSQCILYNNYDIFNFLLSEDRLKINNSRFTFLLVDNMDSKKINNEFIFNLINNYKNKLTNDISIIKICLENNFDEDFIIKLVNDNLYYSLEEIEIVLKTKNIKLLKLMVEKLKY